MTFNIAQRLRESAAEVPQQPAVIAPTGRRRSAEEQCRQLSFEQLDRESDRLARGLVNLGATTGDRLVLMVRPGLEFVALTFAAFKAGAVVVLIDPGMGRSHIFRCLEEVQPSGFLAIPRVHLVRRCLKRRFGQARLNVTVGRPVWSDTVSYQALLGGEWEPFPLAQTTATDPAAIIFTSGSTGPPKGVVYEHGMFDAQVRMLRDQFAIMPGEVDLPGFPLFALFNAAMRVTTVIPDMDPTRPARVDPRRIVAAIRQQRVTQAFGSPAMWNRVGRYCESHGVRLPSLKRVFSAGAPVPLHVIERMRGAMDTSHADIHTPYGATEALPVTTICGGEIVGETAARSRLGAGTCVGKPFPQVDLRVIAITDAPIESMADVRELPVGEIGEIIVRSPSVTREYFRRPDATRWAKIADGSTFWHRMGDVGYRDEQGRLWFCGRKAHIVYTAEGPLFTVPCEAIFNEHPHVYRSALVGVGERPHQRPVVVVEPEAGTYPWLPGRRKQFVQELHDLALQHPHTKGIETFLFRRALPVDVRHNTKIAREQLAVWAADRLGHAVPKAC